MDDILRMEIVQPFHNATDDKLYMITETITGLLLVKVVLFIYVVTQVAWVEVIHQQVEVLPILEGKFHVDDEHIVVGLEFAQKLFLVHDWSYAAFCDDSCLVNDLQRVDLFGLFLHHFPHSAESALSYDLDEVEIALVV